MRAIMGSTEYFKYALMLHLLQEEAEDDHKCTFPQRCVHVCMGTRPTCWLNSRMQRDVQHVERKSGCHMSQRQIQVSVSYVAHRLEHIQFIVSRRNSSPQSNLKTYYMCIIIRILWWHKKLKKMLIQKVTRKCIFTTLTLWRGAEETCCRYK